MTTSDPLLQGLSGLHPERRPAGEDRLFGSRARGDSRSKSDFDVLVIQESEQPRHRRSGAIYKALASFPAEVDVIVYATGFKPMDITHEIDIRGLNGESLREAWEERIASYRSVMVRGFPNLFFMMGPNSAGLTFGPRASTGPCPSLISPACL